MGKQSTKRKMKIESLLAQRYKLLAEFYLKKLKLRKYIIYFPSINFRLFARFILHVNMFKATIGRLSFFNFKYTDRIDERG